MSQPPEQQPLWHKDELDQLRPPWWSVLGGNLAVAAVAEVDMASLKRAQPKGAEHGEVTPMEQQGLDAEVSALKLPRTLADCRGPGICPLFRCQFNLVLHVRSSYNKTSKKRTETIKVGGVGGLGKGASIATHRNSKGRVSMKELDAVVDEALDLIDQLPSTCALDYVENPQLIPRQGKDSKADRALPGSHMTLEQIGTVLGLTREGVRRIGLVALHKAKMTPLADELDPTWVPVERLQKPKERP